MRFDTPEARRLGVENHVCELQLVLSELMEPEEEVRAEISFLFSCQNLRFGCKESAKLSALLMSERGSRASTQVVRACFYCARRARHDGKMRRARCMQLDIRVSGGVQGSSPRTRELSIRAVSGSVGRTLPVELGYTTFITYESKLRTLSTHL